ncbi:MAG: TlpA family protein disulfide reductase [Planctomycetes bacterium]|nr:TlpA family protein disulfide reductase [Planctomycetota bacterium]
MRLDLALVCSLSLAVLVAPLCAEATLTGINLGTHVDGPKVSASDLQGRVVLFEYWGVNCPPCVGSIHHLTELQAKYGRDNFLIVANHCQGGSADNTRTVWRGKASNDLVSVVDSGALPGSNVTGIPRCFLFDHEGKLVFDGSPSQVDGALEQAMRDNPGQMVAGRTYQKLTKEAATLGAQKTPLAATLKALRKAAEGDDAAAKDEADFLLGRVGEWQAEQLEKVGTARAEDPERCLAQVTKMAALLKGDELGEPFATLQDEFKKDKAFQTELKAAAALAAIRADADKCKLSKDPTSAKAQKSNQAAIAGIAANLKGLQKKFADTAAARRAAELSQEWGL